eukprot:TRINITY_DN30812_c0_g1_i1.p1 TRINITY_DN30812_c0_g1~~TRINITY_DN30812_c0_g1_i1.p1  ORF type:complete len:403 (+),score=141.97 TRINITY_DN30812_c0_g1_i1:57-1265(+)
MGKRSRDSGDGGVASPQQPLKKPRKEDAAKDEQSSAAFSALFSSAATPTQPKYDIDEVLAPIQKRRYRVRKEGPVRKLVVLVDDHREKEEAPSRTPEEEAARLRRTVFVTNLPNDCEKSELTRLFRRCGAVDSARVRQQSFQAHPDKGSMFRLNKVNLVRGRLTAHATCSGYVVFKDEASVEKAIAANGALFGEVRAKGEGRDNVIQVDRADRAADPFGPDDSIFVGNILLEATDQQVRDFFTDRGMNVAQVRLVRDPETRKGKGFGFVRFASGKDLQKALNMKGETMLGRELRVKRVRGRSRETDERLRNKRHILAESEPRSGPKKKEKKARAKVRADPTSFEGAHAPRKSLSKELRKLTQRVKTTKVKQRAKQAKERKHRKKEKKEKRAGRAEGGKKKRK